MISSPPASVSNALLGVILRAARARGMSERSFRRAIGAPASTLETRARVPIAIARQAWSAAANLCGDPDLGLHAVSERPAGIFGPFEVMIANSPTGGDGLRRFSRFMALANSAAALRVEARGRVVHVIHETVDGARPSTDLLVALIVEGARTLIDPGIRPLWVAKMHDRPSRLDEYERLVGSPVHFGARATEVAFDREILSARNRKARPAVADVLEAFLLRGPHRALLGDSALPAEGPSSPASPQPSTFGLGAEVRMAIRICLDQGDARVANVAHVLGTSARSLQRHLRAGDMNFRQVVDEVRLEVARIHLPFSSKARIATALGYSERRAFTRAAHRWEARD